MKDFLAGRTVGFVVANDGVEEDELSVPRRALVEGGGSTVLIAPRAGEVRTVRDGVLGSVYEVGATLAESRVGDLDAVVLPDGKASSAALRAEQAVVSLLQASVAGGRAVGIFGFAAWSLIDAGLVVGREVTSHPALRGDLVRAGAKWRDQRVVVDDNLITSRSGLDVEAFTVQLISYLDR